MTKKPSEKNKAWEKDRRDRLNKTFDELAKLLPKFDKSVVWSKIEIIQKAITFIEELQKRLEDYLIAKDPELLKEYKEFVNCLRFYQERNAQLTELLKKAKVTLPAPPVELPQLLVNKPELLPNQENAQVVQPPKPKRQRNRSKKANNVESAKKDDQVREDKNCPVVENKPPKTEVVAKPTAIITALGRESVNESPPKAANSIPAPQPPVPAKPLLLRMRKLRKRHQRLKLVPRPMFRKCYPHPSRMAKWNYESISSRKLSIKQRRQGLSRKRAHLPKAAKPSKRLKVDQPLREQSVSPTAAFLLSFPVVTSSMLGGKNVENTDNLENLNNFFTTEEYSKFCDQNSDGKILSPLPVESEAKPSVSEKPMTLFTVSAITRPSTPKKIPETNGTRCQGMSGTSTTVFDGCFGFGNANPMIGSTSMCGAGSSSNNQQTTSKEYPGPNRVPVLEFPPVISTAGKLPPKQEQANLQPCEKFIPRYNHSASSSLRNALESPLNSSLSNRIQKDSSGQSKLNWPAKPDPPRVKSITNQISKSPSSAKIPAPTKTAPFVSPSKNFFYDFPTQNRNNVTDPLISATTAPKVKSNNSVKSEFPWLPPNAAACNQNTIFTPFDLATIVCDSLTSTSFTASLSQSKSTTEPAVVDVNNKTGSNGRCNQMNLFLPYEEAQYTPNFQTRPTEAQSSSWKSLDKPKEPATDQIFYDCEQSKPQTKSHVNWMTSPTTTDFTSTSTNALPLPPMDFGSQFAGGSTNFDLSFVGCRKDSYDDDNQFINWSPTKPLNADFSTAYSFENFGSNEAPPNKTVKQIFSVSQLVDQTPSQDITSPMKKKVPTEKSTATTTKQSFSNIYSAESLIAKKDNNRFYNQTETATGSQGEYHNSNSYFFGYPNAQSCSENDYLGAGTYQSSQSTVKNNTNPNGVGGGFDTTTTSTNYFPHSISSNNNDPYDPTYFPSSNYNQSWNHGTAAVSGKTSGSLNIYNQAQFGTSSALQETQAAACQQNSSVSGNLTNFNLSSICPEIDGKGGTSG